MPSEQRRRFLSLLPALPLAALAGRADAQAATGRFDTRVFVSRFVDAHTVRVWLPPDYEDGEACEVLYMQDGQNLFAPANPWNHGPWAVDRQILALRANGRLRKAMVVGIDCSASARSQEYAPQRALEKLPAKQRQRGIGPDGAPLLNEAYLRCLIEELMPFVEKTYRCRTGREATHLMGSSLGAVLSLTALTRFPALFGAAACLSTHWPIALGKEVLEGKLSAEAEAMSGAFLAWLRDELPMAGAHRLYFDHGDQGLDALYGPFQARMDAIAVEKGYREGHDYQSRFFPGASHDESFWRARLGLPLAFLLGTKSQ